MLIPFTGLFRVLLRPLWGGKSRLDMGAFDAGGDMLLPPIISAAGVGGPCELYPAGGVGYILAIWGVAGVDTDPLRLGGVFGANL